MKKSRTCEECEFSLFICHPTLSQVLQLSSMGSIGFINFPLISFWEWINNFNNIFHFIALPWLTPPKKLYEPRVLYYWIYSDSFVAADDVEWKPRTGCGTIFSEHFPCISWSSVFGCEPVCCASDTEQHEDEKKWFFCFSSSSSFFSAPFTFPFEIVVCCSWARLCLFVREL